MRRAPRVLSLLALAITAVCLLPQHGRGAGPVIPLDYATVGRVVSRVVDGRTVVVIPVAGAVHPKLSEPIRIGKLWRLVLVIEGARLSIAAPVRQQEGLAALTVEEVGSDVRITADVKRLGDYGTRPSEEGMLLWIDPDRRTPVEAAAPATSTAGPASTGATASRTSQEHRPAVKRDGSNWGGMIGLVVAAAVAGAVVRHVRRNGAPAWSKGLWSKAEPLIRGRLNGGTPRDVAAAVSPDVTEEPGSRLPFASPPADPRGRSAEIGDAFRVEPERPASGIAALVAANDNDAE